MLLVKGAGALAAHQGDFGEEFFFDPVEFLAEFGLIFFFEEFEGFNLQVRLLQFFTKGLGALVVNLEHLEFLKPFFFESNQVMWETLGLPEINVTAAE